MTFHDHRAPRPAVAPPAACQPGPVTMALRAMQATLTKPTRTGPVTDAIRVMRAADPAFDLNPDLHALRRALADRIEADIAALDMLGGDPDLDADYAMTLRAADGSLYLLGCSSDGDVDAGDNAEEENEHGSDDDHGEDSLGSLNGTSAGVSGGQMNWSGGRPGDYEADIQSEPHDAEEDDDRDSGCGDLEGMLEQWGPRSGHYGNAV